MGSPAPLRQLAARLRPPAIRIRTQIVAPFLLLMLILGVVGTYLTTSLVAGSLDQRIAGQLVAAQDAALDAAVKLQGRQMAAIRLVANTEGVDAAIISHDQAALKQLVVPLEVNNRLGTVKIFDTSGRTILEVEQPNPANPAGLIFRSGGDLSSDALVAQVLRGSYDSLGDKWIGYEGSPPSRLAVTGPVLNHDKVVVGGILLETPVTALLAEMRGESLSDVALLDQNGALIGSTLAGTPASSLDERTRAYLDLASPGRAARRTRDVGRQPYEFQFTLFYLRQHPVGYLAVALSRQSVVDAGIRSAVEMTALFAAMVLSLLVIGYILALRITRPIEDLVAGTAAVARGDLSQRIRIHRRDELGRLADSFNAMTDDLQQRTRELNDQVRRLAALQQSRLGLGTTSAPGEMAEAMLGVSLKALGIPSGLLLSRNTETQVLEPLAAVGFTPDAGLGRRPQDLDLADGFDADTPSPVEVVEQAGQDRRPAVRAFAEATASNRALVVPLSRGASNAGYLLLGVPAAYVPPAQEVDVLRTLATEVAVMVENAELHRKAERQARQLDQAIIALEKISQALTTVTVGTDNLLRAVARATAEILEVPYASIHLRKPDWRDRFSDVMVGPASRRDMHAVRASAAALLRRMEGASSVTELDLDAEPRLPRRLLSQVGLRRSVGVSLMLGGEVVGMLAIHMREPRALEKSELRVLQTLANQAVIAIETTFLFEETRHLAMTDPLTGVANHRAFEARLDRELQRAIRSKDRLALVLGDLDHFKEINDSVGHPAGDAVLRYLADQVLIPSVRPKDLVARYGGDEFVLILPGADVRVAMAVAERIREAATRPLVVAGRVIPNLSISLGVATLPRDGETREALVQAADRALYLAKRGGRNRVARADATHAQALAG